MERIQRMFCVARWTGIARVTGWASATLIGAMLIGVVVTVLVRAANEEKPAPSEPPPMPVLEEVTPPKPTEFDPMDQPTYMQLQIPSPDADSGQIPSPPPELSLSPPTLSMEQVPSVQTPPVHAAVPTTSMIPENIVPSVMPPTAATCERIPGYGTHEPLMIYRPNVGVTRPDGTIPMTIVQPGQSLAQGKIHHGEVVMVPFFYSKTTGGYYPMVSPSTVVAETDPNTPPTLKPTVPSHVAVPAIPYQVNEHTHAMPVLNPSPMPQMRIGDMNTTHAPSFDTYSHPGAGGNTGGSPFGANYHTPVYQEREMGLRIPMGGGEFLTMPIR